MHPHIAEALSCATQGVAVSSAQAEQLAHSLGEHLPDLFAVARIAASACEAAPFTCGIINAKSGRCAEDCAFCAQSAHYETQAAVYPLISQDALVQRARELEHAGASYMGIVISGTKPSRDDFLRVLDSARVIRSRTSLKLCASLGLLEPEQARMLKEAGFTSYHHNLETSRSYYATVCSTHAYDLRTESVRNAKEAGLRVCSGGIFGLGESWAHRLELAETLAQLDVDSIPINFLNPIPGTPLGNAHPLNPMEALSIIAMFRLLHPGRDIVICGGRGRTLQDWDIVTFLAGANGIMIGDYLTTKGSELQRDKAMLAHLFNM